MSENLFRALSIIVPLFAVLVSLVVLVRARKVNAGTTDLLNDANAARGRIAEAVESWTSLERKIGEFQLKHLEAVEEASKRADLEVTLEDRGTGHRIVITNNGGAPALDVNLIFDTPGKTSPLADSENALHLKTLGSGKSRPFLAALASGRWPPFNYTLTWKDPSGEEQRIQDELFEM